MCWACSKEEMMSMSFSDPKPGAAVRSAITSRCGRPTPLVDSLRFRAEARPELLEGRPRDEMRKHHVSLPFSMYREDRILWQTEL